MRIKSQYFLLLKASYCSSWLHIIVIIYACHDSLSLSSLKRFREYPNVTLNRPLVPQELHVSPIDPDLAFGTLLEVFITAERCEAPVLRDDDLLAAGKLVLGATEGFNGCCAV